MKTTLIPYSAVTGVYTTGMDIYNHSSVDTTVNITIQSDGKIVKEVTKQIGAYNSTTFLLSDITNRERFQTIVNHADNVFVTSFMFDTRGGITFQFTHDLGDTVKN